MNAIKTTIQARLKVKEKEKTLLDDLMRRWSSCMRYAYKRLLEGKTRNELKRELQKVFNLNSRYVDDAILEAEEVIRTIHLTDRDVPIDIILHTLGGLVLAALQIALAIKKHPAKVTAFVPHSFKGNFFKKFVKFFFQSD